MRLTIEHRTSYAFSQPQRRLIQLLRVTPPSFLGQAVIDWHVEVDCDARLRTGRDGYGNETVMLYVDGPLERITLTVGGEVLTDDRAGMVAGAPDPLPPLLFARETPLTVASEAIAAFARDTVAADADPLGRLHRLCEALHETIAYDEVDGDSTRTAATAFEEARGVCQDQAHVFIAAARSLGVPARYVSGHLWEEGAGLQAATHAWAEAWVEGYGWVGFDPSRGRCPTDAYVRVAAALDYRDAAPVSGARVGGGSEGLRVAVTVARAGAERQN